MAKGLKELLITDMTCARPFTAWVDTDSNVFLPVSPKRLDCWRVVDYSTEHFSGRLLTAISPAAPVLKIPLRRKGWHAISIGLAGRYGVLCRIDVRLSGQERWQEFRSDPDVAKVLRGAVFQRTLAEEPWIFADITDCDLEVRCPPEKADGTWFAGIWSVRAVPVESDNLSVIQSMQSRPMVYTNDGGGIFVRAEEPGPHIVYNALTPFQNSDWNICCFGTGVANGVNYPSKTGELPDPNGWYFVRKFDGNFSRILESMIKSGHDPLRQAIDLAHEHKHRFWTYIRPQGWAYDLIYDHMFRSRFYSSHPEYRCVEADGVALSKMSIAFPAVREQLNGIMKESLDRGADGLCIAFIRGFPVVRYEQPVVERYRKLYDADALQVMDTDEKLRGVWREYVTIWMREVRAMLDSAGPSVITGRRRELSVFVGASPDWDAQYGIDVTAWAKEGLLDAVLLYPHGVENPINPIDAGKIRVDIYGKSLRGTGIPVIPSLGSWIDHKISVAAYRQRALKFYQDGAAGLTRWDTEAWMANLGFDNPETLALWCDYYMPPQDNVITELSGLRLDRFPPGTAG